MTPTTCPHGRISRSFCHVCTVHDNEREREDRRQQDFDHQWTDAELHQLAESITYKPGYELHLQNHPDYPMARCIVRANVWDSTKPDALFQLIFEQTLPNRASRDMMLESIRRALRTLECHEVDEWFRVDGEQFTNPHREPTR
jgi:hypothetical protein